MRTYQIRTYAVDDTNKFDNDKAELRDIIEFTLTDPPSGDNVFQVLKQYEVENKIRDDAEDAAEATAGTIGAEAR